jgi:hypothetical protein
MGTNVPLIDYPQFQIPATLANTLIVQKGQSIQSAIDAAEAGQTTTADFVVTFPAQTFELLGKVITVAGVETVIYIFTDSDDAVSGKVVVNISGDYEGFPHSKFREVVSATQLDLTVTEPGNNNYEVITGATSVVAEDAVYSVVTTVATPSGGPLGVILIGPGDYDEEVDVPAGVGLQGLGEVFITKITTTDGNLVSNIRYGSLVGTPLRTLVDNLIVSRYATPTPKTVLEVTPTGLMKPMGRVDARTNLDRPLEGRIRYTDKKAVVSLVVDDAAATWSTSQWAVLDEAGCAHAATYPTGLEYLLFKGIPVTWGPQGDYMDGAGAELAHFTALRDHIIANGGEIACHSYTHTSRGDDAKSLLETVGNKTILEGIPTGHKLSMRGALHTGYFSLDDDPSIFLGALTRATFAYYRSPGACNLCLGTTLPISPEGYYNLGMDKLESFALTTLNVADQKAGLVELLGVLPWCEGKTWVVYMHDLSADDVAGASGLLRISVWKQLIDSLAALRDAGSIEIVPLSELLLTRPAYRTNMLANGHFGYAISNALPMSEAKQISAVALPYNVTLGTGSTLGIAVDNAPTPTRAHVLSMTRVHAGCSFRWRKMQAVPGSTHVLSFDHKLGNATPTLRVEVFYNVEMTSVGPVWNIVPVADYSTTYRNFAVPLGATEIVVRFSNITDDSTIMLDNVWMT